MNKIHINFNFAKVALCDNTLNGVNKSLFFNAPPHLQCKRCMKQLVQRKIFNSSGDDSIESRQLIGGNPTGIANLNSVKYKWASSLYKIMLNNFWI